MQTRNVKILDCTLRDGGYIVDWMFGKDRIQSILSNLSLAGIDYIECGFLKEVNRNSDKSFFRSVEELENLTTAEQNYTLMVNFGEYKIENFSNCKTPNIKIRVAFKKHSQKDALIYIKQLVNLGWDVFVNPMSTNTYSSEELLELLQEINEIKPLGISIVDTLGNMYEKDVLRIFNFIDKNLDSSIAIGFHSHNSMQLSFSNTKALLKTGFDREIIIDSCVWGMGRGAGNLCTELITQYLNQNCKTAYRIPPILKIIDKELKPIHNKTPWGYSTPYYIAAIHGCHPNYVNPLIEKGCSDEEIDMILRKIPEDKKTLYDKSLVFK